MCFRVSTACGQRKSAVVFLWLSLLTRPSVECFACMQLSQLPDPTSMVFVGASTHVIAATCSHCLLAAYEPPNQLKPEQQQKESTRLRNQSTPHSFSLPQALPPETDINSFDHIVAYTRSSLVESDSETFQSPRQNHVKREASSQHGGWKL